MDILGNHIEGIERTYSELLESISDICRQFEEKHDYSQDILEMAQAETMNDLIRTYNNVIKLLTIKFYGRRKVPRDWYVYQSWGSEHNKYVYEISECLNDSILEWYKRQDSPIRERALLCLANLRVCDNFDHIANTIMKTAGIDDDVIASDVIRHHQIRLEIYKKSKYSSFYETLYYQYKSLSQTLAYNGRIFDVIEMAFGKEHGIDEKKLLECKRVPQEKIINAKTDKIEKEGNVETYLPIAVILLVSLVMFFLLMRIGILGIIVIVGLIGLILNGKIFHM